VCFSEGGGGGGGGSPADCDIGSRRCISFSIPTSSSCRLSRSLARALVETRSSKLGL